MKKWTRWQDYAVAVVGLYTALSTLWTAQAGMSSVLMVTFGVLLLAGGLINLAMPGTPWVEYGQAVVAVLLFISPWLGSYTSQTGAAWTSWIAGAICVVATGLAIRPSNEAHHEHVRMSH
ncbi:SPW repeat protein [Paenarthrobacter sp. DKR-5]|uniref:SPW repeat domain-containing protein n=1 Tax=Paenarthrobacter sp. DKR-5 TaxID=2835535 RepID=UPI001BDBC414|nr:SPW repeat protein [Paenarthrobacter sp. DKR-5]MBT1002380.1 SPW repeat protein [Paenarthrobacter sp. DKR-5]